MGVVFLGRLECVFLSYRLFVVFAGVGCGSFGLGVDNGGFWVNLFFSFFLSERRW